MMVLWVVPGRPVDGVQGIEENRHGESMVGFHCAALRRDDRASGGDGVDHVHHLEVLVRVALVEGLRRTGEVLTAASPVGVHHEESRVLSAKRVQGVGVSVAVRQRQILHDRVHGRSEGSLRGTGDRDFILLTDSGVAAGALRTTVSTGAAASVVPTLLAVAVGDAGACSVHAVESLVACAQGVGSADTPAPIVSALLVGAVGNACALPFDAAQVFAALPAGAPTPIFSTGFSFACGDTRTGALETGESLATLASEVSAGSAASIVSTVLVGAVGLAHHHARSVHALHSRDACARELSADTSTPIVSAFLVGAVGNAFTDVSSCASESRRACPTGALAPIVSALLEGAVGNTGADSLSTELVFLTESAGSSASVVSAIIVVAVGDTDALVLHAIQSLGACATGSVTAVVPAGFGLAVGDTGTSFRRADGSGITGPTESSASVVSTGSVTLGVTEAFASTADLAVSAVSAGSSASVIAALEPKAIGHTGFSGLFGLSGLGGLSRLRLLRREGLPVPPNK